MEKLKARGIEIPVLQEINHLQAASKRVKDRLDPKYQAIRFRIGQVVLHKVLANRGVIYGKTFHLYKYIIISNSCFQNVISF